MVLVGPGVEGCPRVWDSQSETRKVLAAQNVLAICSTGLPSQAPQKEKTAGGPSHSCLRGLRDYEAFADVWAQTKQPQIWELSPADPMNLSSWDRETEVQS